MPMPSPVCDCHPYKHPGAHYADEWPNPCLDGPVWTKLLQQKVPKSRHTLDTYQCHTDRQLLQRDLAHPKCIKLT